MTRIKITSQKSRLIGYWIATGLLSLGMLSGGIALLMKAPANAEGILRLGYPLYFMVMLGAWKISGVAALLIPQFPLLKEWAYAGFFFAMTGAVASHLANGDEMAEIIAPLAFMLLTVLSWRLRPANRKVLTKNIQQPKDQ